MIEYLKDLYRHQEWADGEHWKAFEALPASLNDPALTKRLRHIHLVQRSYLSICSGEKVNIREALVQFERLPMPELKQRAMTYHSEIASFLERCSESALGELVTIPWRKEPTPPLTLLNALTQTPMHSHYHRGQNATRLRELGGEPPMTDFIVWIWKGRPTPAWS